VSSLIKDKAVANPLAILLMSTFFYKMTCTKCYLWWTGCCWFVIAVEPPAGTMISYVSSIVSVA